MSEAKIQLRDRGPILVTGATGYIAGELIPRLLAQQYSVRALVRGATSRLQDHAWAAAVTVVSGDVTVPESLPAALENVEVAYYLVHSLSSEPGFGERDRQGAANFAVAAKQAGVQRVIYLSGLVPAGDPADLSEHLRARCETGATLRQHGPPVTEFRAAMVVGAGSLSFEILRHFVETFLVVTVPKWMSATMQPIAILDVIDYLVAALETPDCSGQIIEIGGADILSTPEILRTFVQVCQRPRLVITVPGIPPRLTARLVEMSAPMVNGLAYPLIVGLRYDAVVQDDTATVIFPHIQPLDFATATQLALGASSSSIDSMATRRRPSP